MVAEILGLVEHHVIVAEHHLLALNLDHQRELRGKKPNAQGFEAFGGKRLALLVQDVEPAHELFRREPFANARRKAFPERFVEYATQLMGGREGDDRAGVLDADGIDDTGESRCFELRDECGKGWKIDQLS